MLEKRKYRITEAAMDKILDVTDVKRKEPNFANAREIRNILDQVIMCQNVRTVGTDDHELGIVDVNRYIQYTKINLPTGSDGVSKKILTGEEELDRLVGLATIKRMIRKISAYAKRGYLISADEVFIADSGEYNKSRRDAVKIQKLTRYLEENPDSTGNTWRNSISDTQECISSLARIKELCEKSGAELTVIACPVYEKELLCYDTEAVKEYYKGIASVVDFWNFSGYNDVTLDARYFSTWFVYPT
jgi:hypothetical protein